MNNNEIQNYETQRNTKPLADWLTEMIDTICNEKCSL